MHPADFSTPDSTRSAQDRLQLMNYVRLFEQQICAIAHPAPFVVGVYGAPGTGKSTFLSLLAKCLREAGEDWRIVEFSPWNCPEGMPLWAGLRARLSILADKAGADDDFGALVRAHQGRGLVLLLDDLDSYPVPLEVTDLLGRLWASLPADAGCLLFISAAAERLSQDTAHLFQHMVRFSFTLPAPRTGDLLDLLGVARDTPHAAYLQRIAELQPPNPHRLRQLLYEAELGLAYIRAELEKVQGFFHEPSLPLMLKWLLLRERPGLREDPYQYLIFEQQVQAAPRAKNPEVRAAFLEALEFDLEQAQELRLAAFLWQDMAHHPFGAPRVLTLYTHFHGENPARSRLAIETAAFNGATRIARRDFSGLDLRGGYFAGLHFFGCDFSFADLSGAELMDTTFERCDLRGMRLDHANLNNSRWLACASLELLDTQADTYEQLAERAVHSWEVSPPAAWNPEPLYKMYKTILNHLPDGHDARKRLLDTGMKVRKRVLLAV